MGYNNFIISSILIIIITIFSTPLLIQTASSTNIQDSYLSYMCTNSPERNNHFGTNLDNVSTDLVNEAPRNYGFSTAFSSSSGNYTDLVYGLALCRHDVPPENCTTCLSNAKVEITRACPNRGAIVWYDFCYLKFADYHFSGQVDTRNKYSMRNEGDARHPKDFYKKVVVELLGGLSDEAGDEYNEGMFGKGSVSFRSWEIYGMAQCSRDILNCTGCLDRAVNGLKGIVFGRNGEVEVIPKGGISLTGSCYVRYQTYPFLLYDD